MKKPVYLDYHATTPCDPEVLAAMLPYLSVESFGNPSALRHQSGRKAAQVMAAAKEKVGALINAVPESLTLTSGATEANNIALLGAAAANKTDRREILVSALEHDSMIHAARHLGGQGYTIKVIPATKDGFITPEAVAAAVSDKTFFVSVLLVNHEIGTIQPIADIAKVVRRAGALLHCDATQGAGKIPLDVKALDVDTLSLSAHKMYGPPGIGALYAKLDVLLSRIAFGGQQQKLRPGTIPLALTVGMGEACRLAGLRMENDANRLRELTHELVQRLKVAVPALRINGALSPRVPGSLNFFVPGVAAEDVLLDLADMLCLSTGAACRSGIGMPSGVLSAIGLTPEEINGAIRLSFGRMTTREEMIFAADQLALALTNQPARAVAAG